MGHETTLASLAADAAIHAAEEDRSPLRAAIADDFFLPAVDAMHVRMTTGRSTA